MKFLHIDPVLISGRGQYDANIDVRCSLKVGPIHYNIDKTNMSTWYDLARSNDDISNLTIDFGLKMDPKPVLFSTPMHISATKRYP